MPRDKYADLVSVSYETIQAIEAEPGSRRHRYPSPGVLEAIADVVGERVEELFPEYRLAVARSMLDERDRPIEEALANLERSNLVPLGQRGAPPLRGETGRRARGPDPSRLGRRRPSSVPGKGSG